MPTHSPLKYIATYFAWFLLGITVLVALPLLLWAHIIDEHSFWHDLIRDVGIAFLVAAIVAAIYELHARSRFDIETMVGVLDATIGEIIRLDVWKAVKCQIIERDMIRQGVEIHLDVKPIAELFGPAVLSMQFEYDLYGLHSKPKENVTLMHYLDAHLMHDELLKYEHAKDLPKFEQITVGSKDYPVTPCPNDHIKDGRFTASINLGAKDGEPIHIITKRKEITYIPGSYNLMMGEITRGVVLHLTGLPPDIEASVNMRPHTEHGVPLRVDDTLRYFKDTILLPGQGIEFRFKYKPTLPKPAPFETDAPPAASDGKAGGGS